jgi:hypothetical protein
VISLISSSLFAVLYRNLHGQKRRDVVDKICTHPACQLPHLVRETASFAKLKLIINRNALVGKLVGKATNCLFSRADCNAVAQLRDFFFVGLWLDSGRREVFRLELVRNQKE